MNVILYQYLINHKKNVGLLLYDSYEMCATVQVYQHVSRLKSMLSSRLYILISIAKFVNSIP